MIVMWLCSFRIVPFLTELRAVMDWVWTDTTLSLSNWICVEDIYANIFILKCWREAEKVLLLTAVLFMSTYKYQSDTSKTWLNSTSTLLFIQSLSNLYSQEVIFFVIEISSQTRTEEEDAGEIHHGRLHHFRSYLHCLVSSSLHVIGQICCRSNQSAVRCVYPAKHYGIWGDSNTQHWCLMLYLLLNVFLLSLSFKKFNLCVSSHYSPWALRSRTWSHSPNQLSRRWPITSQPIRYWSDLSAVLSMLTRDDLNSVCVWFRCLMQECLEILLWVLSACDFQSWSLCCVRFSGGDAVPCELHAGGRGGGKDQNWCQSTVDYQSGQQRSHDPRTPQLHTLLHHTALDFTTVNTHRSQMIDSSFRSIIRSLSSSGDSHTCRKTLQ